MVDKLKDIDDRKLEALFRLETIPDDGFSRRVMKSLKRRLWIRRLALPVAFIIGGAIAVKPLIQLILAFSHLVFMVQLDLNGLSLESIPNGSTFVLGGLLLAAMVMVTRMLEE